MLAADLKKALESYSKADLVLLATELYRVMPKKERDAKELDAMISDFQAHQEKKKKAKTEPQVKPIGALEPQVTLFLEYAYQQYYMAPNRFVRKPDRPKWRSLANAYAKELQQYPTDTEDGKTATQLLEKLYRMLGYASHYHLFPTSTPFKAVHIDQAKFFDIVVTRMLSQDNSAAGLRACLKMMMETQLDQYTWTMEVSEVMVARLKTNDLREMACEQATLLMEEVNAPLALLRAKSGMYSDRAYQLEDQISMLLRFLFPVLSHLGETERAIALYRRFGRRQAGTVPTRPLLDLLEAVDKPILWAREYDKAVAKKTNFGDAYAEVREVIRETNAFPDVTRTSIF